MNASPVLNSKIRAFGKARIDIARRAQTRADWERLWKPPTHPFPFLWEGPWKQCIEYKVDDFAAEVGFFIDVLGLPVIAFDADYAMFTSPDEAFTFAVVPTPSGHPSTPPDALRIQFMVAHILEIAGDLEARGITLQRPPEPVAEDSNLYICSFNTPSGIWIDLWGTSDSSPEVELRFDQSDQPAPKPSEEHEPELLFQSEDLPSEEMEAGGAEGSSEEVERETEYTNEDDYPPADPPDFDDTGDPENYDYS